MNPFPSCSSTGCAEWFKNLVHFTPSLLHKGIYTGEKMQKYLSFKRFNFPLVYMSAQSGHYLKDSLILLCNKLIYRELQKVFPGGLQAGFDAGGGRKPDFLKNPGNI